MYYFCHETIIGSITICADKKAITELRFGEYLDSNTKLRIGDYKNSETEIIKRAFLQLNEYLSGTRKKFDIAMSCTGSGFQLSVWSQLKMIIYGQTKTYKAIASNINSPKSSLAVGGACSKNPIPIFIPCHRVIGSNGSLTGYNGGIAIKKKLLEIEKQQTSFSIN